MDGLLTFAHGQIRLGAKTVPGLLRDMRVGGAVRFDESERDGLSGKAKTPMGWEDCTISLTVDLLTEHSSSCYDKLAEIDALFRGHDNGANPRVLTVSNPHVTSRGIEKVVFSGLQSSETNQDDTLMAILKFTEHRPPIVRAEKRVSASNPSTQDPGLDHAIGGFGR